MLEGSSEYAGCLIINVSICAHRAEKQNTDKDKKVDI